MRNATYSATPATRPEGGESGLEVTAKGDLKIAATDGAGALLNPALTTSVSAALEASHVAKATPGRLHRAFGAISATAPAGTYYVQFLDSATLPADGPVTHVITPIPIYHALNVADAFDTGDLVGGVAGAAGVVIVLSTTLVTKTIAGAYLFATVRVS